MVHRPVRELKPDPRNALAHSTKQIEQIRASIETSASQLDLRRSGGHHGQACLAVGAKASGPRADRTARHYPLGPVEAQKSTLRLGDTRSVSMLARVGAFKLDAARAGAAKDVKPLVDELCQLSPEFAAMWRDNDVRGVHGDDVKHIHHPVLGQIAFEYPAFLVDGRTDLSMVVYNPATPADAEKVRTKIG